MELHKSFSVFSKKAQVALIKALQEEFLGNKLVFKQTNGEEKTIKITEVEEGEKNDIRLTTDVPEIYTIEFNLMTEDEELTIEDIHVCDDLNHSVSLENVEISFI